MLRRLLPCLSLTITACQVDLHIEGPIEISCNDDGECPEGFTCNAISSMCVADNAPGVSSNPQLVLPDGQTALKNGDTLSLGGSGDAGTEIHAVRLLDIASGTTVLRPSGLAISAQGVLSGSFVIDGLTNGTQIAVEVLLTKQGVVSVPEASRSNAVPVDLVAPPAPVRNQIILAETSDNPAAAAEVSPLFNTVVLSGGAGAVPDARVLEVYEGFSQTTLVTTIPVDSGGSFSETALAANLTRTYTLVGRDGAGNASSATTVRPPTFQAITATPDNAGTNHPGLPIVVQFSSDVILAGDPTVTIDGNFAVRESQTGNSYRFTYTPMGDEIEGAGLAVVRISGTDGSGTVGSGTVGTMAVTMTFDFTDPVLAGAAVLAGDPGSPDEVWGAVGAASDAISSTSQLLASVYDGSGAVLLDSGSVASDGSFGPLDIGDNAHDTVEVTITDLAGNEGAPVSVANDRTPPVIDNFTTTPALPSGGTLSVGFQVSDDSSDLREAPLVTIAARSPAAASGTLGTSDLAPHAFTYQTTVGGVPDLEGRHSVSVSVTDAAGNQSSAALPVFFDFTAPSSRNTTPGDRAQWNGSPGAHGVASDGLSGVELVEVSLRRNGDSLFWNGASFAAAVETWLPASFAAPAWSYATGSVTFANGSSYTLRSRARDVAGNLEQPSAGVTFTHDTTLPSAPSGLTASSGSDAAVQLSWTAPGGTAPSHYLVHYTTAAGSYPPYGGTGATNGPSPITVPVGTTKLSVSGLAPAQYAFAVTAVNGSAVASPYSNPAQALSRWWSTANPPLTSNRVKAAVSPAPDTFVAVGEAGTVWRSADGGTSWSAIASGTSATLNAITTAGTNLVAVGEAGAAVYSSDGGETWSVAQSGTTLPLVSLWANGGGLVIAVGGRLAGGGGSASVLIRSTDSGATWSFPTSAAPNDNTFDDLAAVYGTGSAIVAVGGCEFVCSTDFASYHSTDGGVTWTYHSSLTASAERRAGSLWGTGSTFIAGASSEYIYRSTDAGVSWTLESTGQLNITLEVAGSGSNVVAASANGKIWSSIDVGDTWSVVRAASGNFYSLTATAQGFIATGASGGSPASGLISFGSATGETWNDLSLEPKVYLRRFVSDGQKAVIFGDSQDGDKRIFGSLDNGGTWTSVDTGLQATFFGVWVDETYAVAVGTGGAILRRDASGAWSSVGVPIDFPLSFYGLRGVWGAGAVVIAVGDMRSDTGRAAILRSQDYGETWTPLAIDSASLDAVFGAGDGVVAVSDSGDVAWSDDLGATWTALAPADTGYRSFRQVWGSGGTFVAIGGFGGEVYRSVNGGQSWTGVATGAASDLMALAGQGSRVVVASGGGEIAVSDNLGAGWTLAAATQTTSQLNSLWLDGDRIVAVGSNGVVTYSSNAGGLWTLGSSGTTDNLSLLTGTGLDLTTVATDLYGTARLLHSQDGGATFAPATHFLSPVNVATLNDAKTTAAGDIVYVGYYGSVIEEQP